MSATATLPLAGEDRPEAEVQVKVIRPELVHDDNLRMRGFSDRAREVVVKIRGFFGRAWRWTKNKATALFRSGQDAARATWDKAIVPAASWVGSNVGAAWEWLRPARSWVTTPLRAGATVAAAGFAYLATGPGVLLLALPILTYVLVAGATRTKPIIDGEVVATVPTAAPQQSTMPPTAGFASPDGVVTSDGVRPRINELQLNQAQVDALTARMEQHARSIDQADKANNHKLASQFVGRRQLASVRRDGRTTPAQVVYQQYRAEVEATLGKAEANKRYNWPGVRQGCLAEVAEVDAVLEQYKGTTE